MYRYEGVALAIVLLIAIVILFHMSTRLSFQKIFNETIYVGDRPLDEVMKLPKKVKRNILKGRSKLKKSRLVIAGCLRDRADHIPKIIKMVEAMGELALDYKILVVENDSSDSTRELLLKWVETNSKVEVLGCGINSVKCKLNLKPTLLWDVNPTRMSKMRYIREVYLDRIKEAYNDWEYVLVWDYDLDGFLYREGVCHSVETLERTGVAGIGAYGHYKMPMGNLYYDPFAYHPISKEDFDPNGLFDSNGLFDPKEVIYCRKPDKLLWNLKLKPGEVSPCTSAFAGASLYRTGSMCRSSYNLEEGDDPLACEHKTFSDKLGDIMLVDGTMQFIVLENPRYTS